MKLFRFLIFVLPFVVVVGAGCSNVIKENEVVTVSIENPTAEEILESDPNADIFQFDGVIYQTGIGWVEELTLTKGKRIGEIMTKNDTDLKFNDNMSNRLPVGAKIYKVNEAGDMGGPVLLVETGGKLLAYYGLVEG